MKYTKHITNVPQTEQLTSDQVKNNAGGYVFKASEQTCLERFLILGTEDGSYYAGERQLTVENAKNVIEMIRKDGVNVLSTVKDILTQNRAPKVDSSLFVLALLCTHGNQAVKELTYSVIPSLCKTSTHLFMFISFVKPLRGWSRGLRTAVANWYTNKDVPKLEYQISKYRNRHGYTHKDVVKLSHPKARTSDQSDLFKYVVGKAEATSEYLKAVEKTLKNTNVKEVVSSIQEHELTWEMVSTEVVNDPSVLEALVPNMQLTALIRNLNRITKAGLVDSATSATAKLVRSMLTDEEAIKKAKLHPITVLNAIATYSSGRGAKGSLTWTPAPVVLSALQKTLEIAFTQVESSGKNILIAVDTSGSMNSPANGMNLSCSQAAGAMALAVLKTEENADIIFFDGEHHTPNLHSGSTYEQMLKEISKYSGSTDCSQPFLYATTKNIKYDAIIILTDNETWAGRTHPVQAYEQYARKINPNVKVINLGFCANQYNIIPETNTNSFQIAGFDSAVPTLIKDFIGE